MKVYTLAITPYGTQNTKLESAKCSAMELEVELSDCYHHSSKSGTAADPITEIKLGDSLRSSIKCLTVLHHAKPIN